MPQRAEKIARFARCSLTRPPKSPIVPVVPSRKKLGGQYAMAPHTTAPPRPSNIGETSPPTKTANNGAKLRGLKCVSSARCCQRKSAHDPLGRPQGGYISLARAGPESYRASRRRNAPTKGYGLEIPLAAWGKARTG